MFFFMAAPQSDFLIVTWIPVAVRRAALASLRAGSNGLIGGTWSCLHDKAVLRRKSAASPAVSQVPDANADGGYQPWPRRLRTPHVRV
jgi:hypothetical protein